MDTDDLTALLPAAPQPRELPHYAAHLAGLLAVLDAEPPGMRAAPSSWPSARRLHVPLAAAAAVTAIVLAAILVPLPRLASPATGRGHHPQPGLGQPPPFRGSGSLPAFRRRSVPSAGIDSVVVRTTAGQVTVAADIVPAELAGGRDGRALGAVAIGAKPLYHGTAPVVTSVVRGTVLTVSARCLPASGSRCQVSLTVTLPHGMTVQASSQLGDVTVTGITGPVSVTDSLGEIQLDNLAGPVTATAVGGDIDGFGLTSSHASLTADLGDINLAFTAPPTSILATDQEGDITLTVPATADYRVTAQSQLGSTSVTVPRSAGSPHVILATSQLGDVTVTG
jgi:hypothetical protein